MKASYHFSFFVWVWPYFQHVKILSFIAKKHEYYSVLYRTYNEPIALQPTSNEPKLYLYSISGHGLRHVWVLLAWVEYSNEQTVMPSLMIELAKFIPVKLNLQGCIQVFWISYVVYFWITQITQTLKMASHECHGLFENPLTDFLIILITLRVESLQPASSGRDQTSNWVVLCRGWTDAWLRDWVVWWEDQLSPPVWEFLFSPVERLRERLNS